MAKKKKKPVETIKLDGLSTETIKEFAPKENPVEEDKLWEEYFLGSPKVLDFPSKQPEEPLPSPISKDQKKTTAVTTVTGVSPVATVTNATAVTKARKSKKIKQDYITLDSTQTKSEQLVYSIMYRETISKGKVQDYFSLRKLMKMTGIGSDKTVFNALKGLRAKLSIQMVEHSNNKPIGTLYKVFTPKEIFKLREGQGILIDIHTKRIVTTAVAPVTTVDDSTQVTQAKSTTVTSVENTIVETDTPYIKINKDTNKDDSMFLIESSSDDDAFNHKNYIISLYEKYTGNKWRAGDEECYKSIKGILPDIIEAGIIASVLRSKSKVNSFAYCEGAVHELKENLPAGYLGYLREKWEESKEKRMESKETAEPTDK